MLMKLIKKIFSVKQKEETTTEQSFNEEVKEKKKIKLKAGTEEWLAYVAQKDPYKYEAWLAEQGRKRELSNVQDSINTVEKRLICFEFVPKMQGSRNVRSYAHYTYGNYKKWKSIRDNEEAKADCKCIVCGYDSKSVNEKTSKTDCHEVWHYDIKTKVQRLVRLESLCTVCHKIKHLDQHEKDEEKFNVLIELYSVLNDISLEQAHKDYKKHLDNRKQLDNVMFKYIDMSVLTEYEIEENKFECYSKEFNDFVNTTFRGKSETD
jgi:hypothetical protein